MIYMDNAATTLQKPEEVKRAILYALEHMGNAGRGGTEAALDASRSIYAVREKLADFFHAESPTRIAFTANSTESLNIALKGLFQPGDHVITTVLEHNSVLRPLYWCQEQGVELTILNCDEKGNLDFQVISEEGDYLFDEIGSVLKIKEYQETKKELLEALELYYRTFFLGENVDWEEEKEDQEGDDKGETDEV